MPKPLYGHHPDCPCCAKRSPFTKHGPMRACEKCGEWHSAEWACAPKSSAWLGRTAQVATAQTKEPADAGESTSS